MRPPNLRKSLRPPPPGVGSLTMKVLASRPCPPCVCVELALAGQLAGRSKLAFEFRSEHLNCSYLEKGDEKCRVPRVE